MADAELVDMEFGTGAVKITPAHDPNDFDTGKRHNLEFINILTDDGKLNHQGGQFQGLPRFQVYPKPHNFAPLGPAKLQWLWIFSFAQDRRFS